MRHGDAGWIANETRRMKAGSERHCEFCLFPSLSRVTAGDTAERREQAEKGIAASIVADVRAVGQAPVIRVVSSGSDISGMQFICRNAVEVFYEKIAKLAELEEPETLANPAPFDAYTDTEIGF